MKPVYEDQHYNLVVDCKKGSQSAHYQLYKLYSKAMYNIALKIVNDGNEAADILQESFIDAFTRLRDFRQEISFGLWLKQIVVHKSIQHLRKRKFNVVSTEDEDVEDIPNETEESIDDTECRIGEVRSAILLLPDGFRIVLTLYLLEGYDHAEIAYILGITESTSRSQLTRGKKKLLELLNEGKDEKESR